MDKVNNGSEVPSSKSTALISPCVGVCRLDTNYVCVGCDRTLDEIARWSQMTNEERKAVMGRVRFVRPETG